MVRLEGQSRIEIGLPIGGRFARHAEDQVQRQLQSGIREPERRRGECRRADDRVRACEVSADWNDWAPRLTRVTPCCSQQRDQFRRDIGRIGFDAEFVARRRRMPVRTSSKSRESCGSESCVGVPPPKKSVSTGCGCRGASMPANSRSMAARYGSAKSSRPATSVKLQ